MDEPVAPDLEVDASGLKCPLPILRAKKALATLVDGQVLRVISTDPGSRRDFEQFTRQTGHELLAVDEDERCWTFLIRRRPRTGR